MKEFEESEMLSYRRAEAIEEAIQQIIAELAWNHVALSEAHIAIKVTKREGTSGSFDGVATMLIKDPEGWQETLSTKIGVM